MHIVIVTPPSIIHYYEWMKYFICHSSYVSGYTIHILIFQMIIAALCYIMHKNEMIFEMLCTIHLMYDLGVCVYLWSVEYVVCEIWWYRRLWILDWIICVPFDWSVFSALHISLFQKKKNKISIKNESTGYVAMLWCADMLLHTSYTTLFQFAKQLF